MGIALKRAEAVGAAVADVVVRAAVAGTVVIGGPIEDEVVGIAAVCPNLVAAAVGDGIVGNVGVQRWSAQL